MEVMSTLAVGKVAHSMGPDLAARVTQRYGVASTEGQTRILAALLRPLGSLALVAVANGAFIRFLFTGGRPPSGPFLSSSATFKAEDVLALARYVEQKSPEVLQELLENSVSVDPLSADLVGLSRSARSEATLSTPAA
jgi:hypothetical protein